MSKVIRIERVSPRSGRIDNAYLFADGYRLGNPGLTSKQRKLRANCKSVATLDEAAIWIKAGWHIRMGDTYRTASLIQPSSVQVVTI